ncbi:alanine racemase, partial [Mycolicibacterium insubricum]|nr:alanine racemase [Mycolicibacterium insubricum]
MTEPARPGPLALRSAVPTALVDLDAISANVAVLCEKAGSAQVMAVVKADGYGHGAAEAATAALVRRRRRIGCRHGRGVLALGHREPRGGEPTAQFGQCGIGLRRVRADGVDVDVIRAG